MKNYFLVLLSFLFITSCSQKEKIVVESVKDTDIEKFLEKANDFNINKQERLKYSEKASTLIKLKNNDSITRYYYFKLAARYFNLNELEKYISTCRDVYKMSLESNDSLGIAESLHYIGDYHYNKFINDSAYYYYSKSEKTYLNLKKNVDRIRSNKANILFYVKDFSGCEEAVISILKSAKQNKDQRLIYDCYITLGNSLDGLNNNRQALNYYNKAFSITKNLTDDPQLILLKAQAYNYIGRVYLKEENFKEAKKYFKGALLFEDFKNTDSLMYANLINNLAYSNFKSGDESAINLLEEALEIRQSLNNIPGIVSSKINLSEFHLQQKDTLKALILSKEAKKIANENKIFEDELKTLKLLARINPKNDSYYNNRFIKLTDSLQNHERATRNKFARIEFETDEILIQKNNIEAERNKISSQRWLILGFSLFVILILGLLYLAKWQHSKNKELQFIQEQQKVNEDIYQLMLDQQSKIDEGRQKEKSRIAQELHDGIMSKLTSTRLNLFILTKKNDEDTIKKCITHIEGIQNIEKEIRAISHDLSKDIFAGKDSFKLIISDLFKNQQVISTVNCKIDIDETINWELIGSTIKMNLYRIFQETLQNIYKYAKASHVEAKIFKDDNNLFVIVKDDGVGFDTKKIKEGIGIKNMKSRAKVIKGSFEIKSIINKGTTTSLIIPIN